MKKKIYVLFALLSVVIFSSFALWNNATATTANNAETTSSPNETAVIEWLTLEEAFNRNQKEPRKVFIDVYTDWCGWCKKMDKTTFADGAVAEYSNKNYYAVKLNAESTKEMTVGEFKLTERDVARQFKVSSFPTIVLMESDFRTITPVPGYRQAGDFLTMLKDFNEAKAAEDK